MRYCLAGLCLMLVGCGSVTHLSSTSPFRGWVGQRYPAAGDLYLFKHHALLARGEASYRLSEYDKPQLTPLATYEAGTRLLVTGVVLRSRWIGLPHIYLQVEAPFNDGAAIADVEMLQEPYPMVVDWPSQRLQTTGDERE